MPEPIIADSPGAGAPPATSLTARDLALFYDLYRFGALLRGQIQEIHFPACSLRRCNRRLERLRTRGLLAGSPLPLGPLAAPTAATRPGVGGSQWVYRLANTREVAALLARHLGALAPGMETEPAEIARRLRRGSPTALAHALEIANVYVTLLRLSRRPGSALRLARFAAEAEAVHAYRYRTNTAGNAAPRAEVFRPDAYACIEAGGPWGAGAAPPSAAHHLMFEVDLGHTSSGEWQRKAAVSLNYLRLGLFERRYGAPSFLGLVLTTSGRRAGHLRRIAEAAGASHLRFSTLDAFAAAGPLAPIWHAPGGGTDAGPLVPGPRGPPTAARADDPARTYPAGAAAPRPAAHHDLTTKGIGVPQ
jgi:hypothetical protein